MALKKAKPTSAPLFASLVCVLAWLILIIHMSVTEISQFSRPIVMAGVLLLGVAGAWATRAMVRPAG